MHFCVGIVSYRQLESVRELLVKRSKRDMIRFMVYKPRIIR